MARAVCRVRSPAATAGLSKAGTAGGAASARAGGWVAAGGRLRPTVGGQARRSAPETGVSLPLALAALDNTLVRSVAGGGKTAEPAAPGRMSSADEAANAARVRLPRGARRLARADVGVAAVDARGDQQQTPEEHRERQPAEHAIHQPTHPGQATTNPERSTQLDRSTTATAAGAHRHGRGLAATACHFSTGRGPSLTSPAARPRRLRLAGSEVLAHKVRRPAAAESRRTQESACE